MPRVENNILNKRIVSIDAFRGFDMLLIIGAGALISDILSLINNPFAEILKKQFEHPEWSGFTAWDMIFPTFLFIVGLSIPFAILKRHEKGNSKDDIYIHLIKRTLILFFFGMLVEAGRIDMLGGLRYTGVLQRIAVCYFTASVIFMHTRVRGQIIWVSTILILYWLAMTFIPVPGYGAGVFTPEGNLASYIDRNFLPGALRQKLVDNEGILSTFPAIATTLLGVICNRWLRSSFSPNIKTTGLFFSGAVLIAIGLLWNTIFPINKLIWTSSFVLFAGGVSLIAFGIFYWLIDVRQYKSWAFPLVVIGMNALTIYIVGGVFDFGRIVTIFTYEFSEMFGTFKPLFIAVCILTVKWLFLFYLYKRKIFLKA